MFQVRSLLLSRKYNIWTMKLGAQWHTTFRFEMGFSRNHGYTFRYWTHRIANRTTSAIVGNKWQMSFSIERNGLVARIVASHVTFAAIYAHALQKI